MKEKFFVSLVIVFLSSLLFISCQDNRDDTTMDDETRTPGITGDKSAIDATDDFWDTEREYTYADREEFKNEFHTARERLDQKINELQVRADNATGEEKERLNDQIDKLKEKRDNLDSEWRDFSKTTEENWEEFKSDMNSAWNDVETAWEDVKSEVDETM